VGCCRRTSVKVCWRRFGGEPGATAACDSCSLPDHPEARSHRRRVIGDPRNLRRGRAARRGHDVSRVRILPIADFNEEIARLADVIEGVAGEWSPFEEQHGFSIDGVDLTTVVLPDGWARTTGESAERQHRRTHRAAEVHRLVPGAAGPVCGVVVRRAREGPQLRARVDRGGPCRPSRHRGATWFD
jgi:hypothetical protein